MKITIYELLGLVKDGKAPNNARIRYFDRHNDYYDECNLKENEIINRLHFGNIELNDEVEILEEEKEIPEKVDFDISNFSYKEYELNIMRNNVIANTKAINQLIDYLKSKGDE